MSDVIKYAEYAESGDLTHYVEVYISEGELAPPLIPEPLVEDEDPHVRQAEREKRAQLRRNREVRIAEVKVEIANKTRCEIEDRGLLGERVILLPDSASVAWTRTHRVERGKLRELTAEERAERQSRDQGAQAPTGAPREAARP